MGSRKRTAVTCFIVICEIDQLIHNVECTVHTIIFGQESHYPYAEVYRSRAAAPATHPYQISKWFNIITGCLIFTT